MATMYQRTPDGVQAVYPETTASRVTTDGGQTVEAALALLLAKDHVYNGLDQAAAGYALDARAALALLGRLPVRNLLDNGDFGPPRVNQRGASGTISAVGYFLDRWKLTSGNVTIGDDCIMLNGTMAQISETAWGTDVTASVKLRSGTATIEYDNATQTTTITSSGGVLLRAKLEIGALSTIDYDPPQDYGTELLKCQRFFVAYPYAMPALCMGFTNTTEGARFTLLLPVTMRAIPSISYSAINQFRIVTNGTTFVPTALSTSVMSGNSVWLTATLSGAPVGQIALLRVLSSNNVFLSADL